MIAGKGYISTSPGTPLQEGLPSQIAEACPWDIIEAIEGPSFFFQCAEIRKKNIFVDDPSVFTAECPCLIKVVIQEAEELMRNRLRTKSLRWLYDQVKNDFPEEKKRALTEWINAI